VEDGVTGFVVADLGGAVRAVERVARIDRYACRRRVEERFSVAAMVDGYIGAYRAVLGEHA
jgi:hypothetical protein